MESKKSEIYQRWDDGFLIRRMRRNEEQQVTEWFNRVASMSVDLKVVLDMRGDDPDIYGYYIGELNGEAVASLAETQVADDVRFASYMYVVEQHRKSGFSRRMIATAQDVCRRHNWTGITGIDAVPYVESMWQKHGYERAFSVFCCKGYVSADFKTKSTGFDMIPIGDAEFDRMMTYDDKCFVRPGSSWRREFMSRWVSVQGGRAVMAVNQQGRDVIGYGCRRPAAIENKQHMIGPLYADSREIARNLVHELTRDIVGQIIYISVVEPNEDALSMIRELKLDDWDPLLRMYRNGHQSHALSNRVFGITSHEVCGF